MSLIGIFTKMRPQIDELYFDALLEESSELTTEVSEYPLEDGRAANDNAVYRPLIVTMTVAVSDNWYKSLIAKAGNYSTIAGIAGGVLGGKILSKASGRTAAIGGILGSAEIEVLTGMNGKYRSAQYLDEIRRLQKEKTVMDVVGAKKTYNTMIISSTRTTITPENEGGLELVVEFRELVFAEKETKGQTLPKNDTASTQAQPCRKWGILALL